MKRTLKAFRYGSAALLVAASLMALPVAPEAHAQNAPAAAQRSAVLSEATVRALQEALNEQGIAVKADGVMNDETRNAIRRYQSQHHLPVTGEADKATLDKLGVVAQSDAAPGLASTVGQAPSPPSGATLSPQTPMQPGPGASAMMSGPMMQGMMQGMMQTMQGMMGMMQSQSQPGQARPESEPQSDQRSSGMMSGTMTQGMMQGMMTTMRGMMGMMQGQAQPGSMMSDAPMSGRMQRGAMRGPRGAAALDCAMVEETERSPGPAMMQMMQGMMQMMNMMQSQMQSGQRP